MTRTYAIPDIHGRLDLLNMAFDRILTHAAGEHATIVTLGDYVDRGPDSRGVIERLMGWQSGQVSLVSLKGNHEAMMWEVCNNLAELPWWLRNGADATLVSYGGLPNQRWLGAIPQTHLDWISGLPILHADKHRIFVHAGLDPAVPLAQQSQQTVLWMRYPKGHTQGLGSRHIVHGHHAHPEAPLITRGRTNLDAMAWKTGRLVIGVFDDSRPGGATEFLEVVAAPA